MSEITLGEISDLEIRLKTIQNELNAKQKKFAEDHCPYKIGQIFTKTENYGWQRKTRTTRAVLKGISFIPREPFYELRGLRLRKSGIESKYDAYMQWGGWKPEE